MRNFFNASLRESFSAFNSRFRSFLSSPCICKRPIWVCKSTFCRCNSSIFRCCSSQSRLVWSNLQKMLDIWITKQFLQRIPMTKNFIIGRDSCELWTHVRIFLTPRDRLVLSLQVPIVDTQNISGEWRVRRLIPIKLDTLAFSIIKCLLLKNYLECCQCVREIHTATLMEFSYWSSAIKGCLIRFNSSLSRLLSASNRNT
jgi:hypothetical protein